MRQITEKAYDAFKKKKHFTLRNTKVRIVGGNPYLYLHDNLIVKEIDGEIFINNGGWNSNTTRERLNPFTNRIRKTGDSLIINEKLDWDGEWLNITQFNDNK